MGPYDPWEVSLHIQNFTGKGVIAIQIFGTENCRQSEH